MRYVGRTHRVDLDFVSECFRKDTGIAIRYVGTKNQMADLLTKGSFTGPQWATLVELIQLGSPAPPIACMWDFTPSNLLKSRENQDAGNGSIGEPLAPKRKRIRKRKQKKGESSTKCCHVSYARITRYFTPGGPQRSPRPTRSTVKEGSADVNKELNLSTASPIMCSRLCPSTSPYFQVSSYSDMVLGPLQKLLSVCAFVRAGGNLVASYDPPKMNTRTNRNITGAQPEQGRDLASSSGSGGHAGGNSVAKEKVLKSWVLGMTSILKTLGDVAANQNWRILATNNQHATLAKTAEAASNIWKQFNESPDWTYPSTSNLIEKVLDVISAGGNLPATANLTLPPFVRMQDLKPADGIEVFIITDSVSLLGTKGAKKTEDNPHIHEKLWPILSSNFKALTIKAISGCTTERILKEVKELVQAKAGGDPAAFNHVLIIMPTLNELCKNGHETIDQRNPLHPGWFKELGKTLKPMKYKMVIGPGSAEKWKITGKQSFDEMGAELYKEFSNNDIPVCSGLPLYNRMEMRSDGFHFNASHNNLSIYPAYLAASIELTMQIATLNDALQCLQAPAAYAESRRKLYCRGPPKSSRIHSPLTPRRKERLHEGT